MVPEFPSSTPTQFTHLVQLPRSEVDDGAPCSNEAGIGVRGNRRRVRTDPISRRFWAIEAASGLTQALIQGHEVEPLRLQQLNYFLGQWDDVRIRSALSRGAEVGRSIPHVVVESHECGRSRRGASDLDVEFVHHVGDLRGGRGAVLRGIPVDWVEVPGYDGATGVLTVPHTL
jgi:hypothetical protein